MKIATIQSKPIAGNLEYNLQNIIKYINKAKEDKVDLVVFSNGSMTGLNIKGLLYNSTFNDELAILNTELLSASKGIDVLVPTITDYKGAIFEYQTHIKDGELIKCYPATPNDCHEMFSHDISKATNECLLNINDKKISVNCPNGDADLNIYTFLSVFDKRFNSNEEFINAMPDTDIPYLCLNSSGFCNGLVFMGGSFGYSKDKITFQSPYFEESYDILTLKDKTILGPISNAPKEKYELIYKAITNSIKDFINANGFKGIVLGMSGGIDSALVGVLAKEAIGAENIQCLIMPSKYSSNETMSDAEIICNNLGIKYEIIPINSINECLLKALKPFLEGTKADTTEENLQSRIRGILNMAVSNKKGMCLVATGNKSEAATGYYTLYGDSCGSLAPIVDLYKTEVYELSRYINSINPQIPESIIDRPPSAELAPGQKDNDSLPDYDLLDGILTLLMDYNLCVEEVIAEGYDEETVYKVYNLLNKVEFKRGQYPMGISLSETAFQNKDHWDYPITNKFIIK